MIIKNQKDLELVKTPHGIIAKKLYDTENAVIMHLELKPGEKLIPHITPVDVAFYVLEGKPGILIGDEKKQVKVDDIIESPKNIIHCIYNETDKNVRILVIKLPKPTSKTILKPKKS